MQGSFQTGAAYPWTVQPHDVAGARDTWKWRAFNCQTNEEVIRNSHEEAVAYTQEAAGRPVSVRTGEREPA